MRSVTTAAADALESALVPGALLVQMNLSSTLRLCTGGWNLTYGGHTYTGVGSLGAVQALAEEAGTPTRVGFSMSGVPASQVSLVLSEAVQGKAVTLRVAILNPSTYAVEDAPIEWAGTLDTMSISEENGVAAVTVTAEHAGVDLLRPVPVRYTNTDQQRLYAGDLGFQYVTDQADRTITWPASTYFRR